MDRWSLWLFYASLLALAVLLLRLALNGLHKAYHFLFSYFATVLVGGLVLIQIPYFSNAYLSAYMTADLLEDVLALLVVLEMYRIALAGHPGLAEFGRAGILTATVLAIFVAGIMSLLDRNLPRGQSANVHRFVTLQRSSDLMVVVFLILIGLFITWFPVEMSRNTALGIAGFSILFFVRAGLLLVTNVLPHRHLAAVNNAALSLETAMALLWAAAIRPEKSREQVVRGHFWDPGSMERLTRQLDSINSALGRFVRH